MDETTQQPVSDQDEIVLVSRKEWNELRSQVAECHRIVTELERELKPALASILSGNFSLSSLLFGGKKR